MSDRFRARLRPAARVLLAGLLTLWLLFAFESIVSHLLLALGHGWDSALEPGLWCRFLLLYTVAGLLVASLPAAMLLLLPTSLLSVVAGAAGLSGTGLLREGVSDREGLSSSDVSSKGLRENSFWRDRDAPTSVSPNAARQVDSSSPSGASRQAKSSVSSGVPSSQAECLSQLGDTCANSVAWLVLAFYAAILVAPLIRPYLKSASYVIVALPLLALGLWELRARARGPDSRAARAGRSLLRAGLLYLPLGTLINLRLLAGSTLLPRNIIANGALAGSCLVLGAWSVRFFYPPGAPRLEERLLELGGALRLRIGVRRSTVALNAARTTATPRSLLAVLFFGLAYIGLAVVAVELETRRAKLPESSEPLQNLVEQPESERSEDGGASEFEAELRTEEGGRSKFDLARRQEEGGRSRLDLVFIVVDTLRADRLGAYGYAGGRSPNIDALARRSLLFEQHISSSSWTFPAMATLFTGLSPSGHRAVPVRSFLGRKVEEGRFGVRPLRKDLPTLASLLGQAGYRTACYATNPYMKRELALGRGFQHYRVVLRSHIRYLALGVGLSQIWLEPFEPFDPTLNAEEMTDLAISYLERPADRPVALVLHYMDPHWPYSPPPRFWGREGPPPSAQGRPVDHLSTFYDFDITYFDEQFGRLIAFLESSGRLEHSVVALTSDHGEAFLEHGSWVDWSEKPSGFDPLASHGVGHGHSLYEELIHVPFLLYVPQTAPRRINYVTRAVDVLPTLLDALGLKPPERLEGQTLLRFEPPPPALSEAILSGHEKKSWRDGPLKLIAKPSYPPGERFELYDLESDPGEKRNLTSEMPERLREMSSALNAQLRALEKGRGMELKKGMEEAPVEPPSQGALKALGYVK